MAPLRKRPSAGVATLDETDATASTAHPICASTRLLDQRYQAAALADALRALLSVDDRMIYGSAWNQVRQEARLALASYQPDGPNLTGELLQTCRRVLYHTPASGGAAPAWEAAVGDMRSVIHRIEQVRLSQAQR